MSPIVSATPLPSKVSIVSLLSSGNGAQITWKPVTGATGYEIHRSEKKNGVYKRIKRIKKQSKVTYTNNNLEVGKKYYYKVVAYTTVSGKRIYGNYSKKKSIKK
jgi:hypothetical protein